MKMFLLVYVLILPPFILIEKPNISYFLSLRIVVKVVKLQFSKLALIVFITTIIFEIICIPLYYFPLGYMSYVVVVSNAQYATTGMMFTVSAICSFVTIYIGMIIYAKLSIDVYLKLKNHVLYEMETSKE